MCVVSMIMDHYGDKWQDRLGPQWPNYEPYKPTRTDDDWQKRMREQLEQWGKPKEPAISDAEIKEFRQLLERAREYDKRNNEPECELESKKEAVKNIAKALGVEIEFL